MIVELNGQKVDIAASDLRSLLSEQGIDPDASGVAVAINDAVIGRSRWPAVELRDGDRIEVITAMQGG